MSKKLFWEKMPLRKTVTGRIMSRFPWMENGYWLVVGKGIASVEYGTSPRDIRATWYDHTDLYALSFAPSSDRWHISVCDGGMVRLFEFGTWQLLQEFPGDFPSGIFSPDGQVLARWREFGCVFVWDVATGKLAGSVPRSESDLL